MVSFFHNWTVKCKENDPEELIVLVEPKNQMNITFNKCISSLHWPIWGVIGLVVQLHFLGHQARDKQENIPEWHLEFICLSLFLLLILEFRLT